MGIKSNVLPIGYASDPLGHGWEMQTQPCRNAVRWYTNAMGSITRTHIQEMRNR